MNKNLASLALALALGLPACPPEESEDAGSTDAAAADAVCSPNFDAVCAVDDDCLCGLTCFKEAGQTHGNCLRTCAQNEDCADIDRTCGVGNFTEIQSEAGAPVLTDDKLCIGTLSQYANCRTPTGRCGDEFECMPSTMDFEVYEVGRSVGIVFDYYNCQETCLVGSSDSCSDPEQVCIQHPSGYFELEGGLVSPKQCNVSVCEANPKDCACDDDLGYSCEQFTYSDGTVRGLCYRVPGLCGKHAQLIGYLEWSGNVFEPEYICDVAEGLGCDSTLGGIDDPASVECLSGIFGEPVTRGVCVAICSELNDSRTGYVQTGNCPPDMACVVGPEGLTQPIGDSSDYIPCDRDSDCRNIPNAICERWIINDEPTGLCSAPYGMCSPADQAYDAGLADLRGVDAGRADTTQPDTAATDTTTSDTSSPDTAPTPDAALDAGVEDVPAEDA